jgi:hypothetical protein
MFRHFFAALLAAMLFSGGEAAAERIIAHNPDYLLPLPRSHVPHFDNAAIIVMSDADANLIVTESEAHMPFTLRSLRIQTPIGDIVRNTSLATYSQIFAGGVSFGDATTANDAIIIEISQLDPGYDYRQPEERRPAGPNEFVPPSTPSAELAVRITFSNADGLLYDTFHPPFAEVQNCPAESTCFGSRISRIRRFAPAQTGFGNSKEVINRALHEATQYLLLVASCEFEADMRARDRGERLTEQAAANCRYPGYQLLDSPT